MEIFITNKKDILLEFFLKNPTKEVHLRELARITKISFPWVRKQGAWLVKQNIVEEKKEHGLVLLQAKRGGEEFMAIKKVWN